MSEQRTIDNIPGKEFKQIVDQFIKQAAAWDGALPADAFFDACGTLADEDTPLKVDAVIIDNELVLETPPESPLTAQGSRIWLEDGRELIIRLRSLEPMQV